MFKNKYTVCQECGVVFEGLLVCSRCDVITRELRPVRAWLIEGDNYLNLYEINWFGNCALVGVNDGEPFWTHIKECQVGNKVGENKSSVTYKGATYLLSRCTLPVVDSMSNNVMKDIITMTPSFRKGVFKVGQAYKIIINTYSKISFSAIYAGGEHSLLTFNRVSFLKTGEVYSEKYSVILDDVIQGKIFIEELVTK